MKNELILVVGGRGTVGTELIKQLKSQGYRTRATTGKPAVTNVKDNVHLNLVTGEGVHAAFEGVDRAFFLSPPGYTDQYALLSPLIQEAKRRGLKKVVMMTAMGANSNEASPFRRAEVDLEKSGLAYNIIRPNWFMQNFNSFWIQQINELGEIQLPAGEAKVSFIDARDIAAVAAKLLTTSAHDQKDFDLTGHESYNHTQVANAISKATGREIKYVENTPTKFKENLLSAGLPKDYADFLVLIFGFLKEGYNAGTNNNIKDITGQQPRSLKQYVDDFKNSWII
jgi:uncharacterized protein YbjT (DUF2867 family)